MTKTRVGIFGYGNLAKSASMLATSFEKIARSIDGGLGSVPKVGVSIRFWRAGEACPRKTDIV